MALEGVARIKGIITGPPKLLWQRVRHCAGISQQAFDNYFAGADRGYGLSLVNVNRFPLPVSLADLRKLLPGFHPPQSFRYLNARELAKLSIDPSCHQRAA